MVAARGDVLGESEVFGKKRTDCCWCPDGAVFGQRSDIQDGWGGDYCHYLTNGLGAQIRIIMLAEAMRGVLLGSLLYLLAMSMSSPRAAHSTPSSQASGTWGHARVHVHGHLA